MFTKEKEKTEKIGQSRASYTMVLMMMTKERKTGVYDVIGQSKAPYKLSSTCPPLGTREQNTKQYCDNGDGNVDDDCDGIGGDRSQHDYK